ncbi:hypothetical protein [Schlesneria paludicola]|uniref:hypothetical protein n=1 Tax=Schlesneria paludicola TaxID=360056 RepID=UPI0012FA8782|nr:hypothetical protein [Schlesneria paludicola]
MIFTVHVAAAFHFEHHWNHAHAYDHTAQRTAEMTGWNSGIGLYVNEVFLGLWIVDVAAWWWAPQWHQKRSVYWIVQAVFAFLMFQATAVFGPPFWRPIVVILLLVLWGQYRRAHRAPFLP